MQRTRLSTLVDAFISRVVEFFLNPWRRISLVIIGLLFGVFVGEAVSTTAGQAANWDVVVAALLLVFTEFISRFVYRLPKQKRSLFVDVLNVFKIGITYSLYLEAFKLGS